MAAYVLAQADAASGGRRCPVIINASLGNIAGPKDGSSMFESAVDALIGERIASRRPAAYLTGEAWLQGVPFFVDERVIVPRSHIGEILFNEYGGEFGSTFLPDPFAVESVVDICTGSGCLAILATRFFQLAAVEFCKKFIYFGCHNVLTCWLTIKPL